MNIKRKDVKINFYDKNKNPIVALEIYGLEESKLSKLNDSLKEYNFFHPFDEGYFNLFRKIVEKKYLDFGSHGAACEDLVGINSEAVYIDSWKIDIK